MVEDTSAQQTGLDCLENWTRSWQIKFNPQKWEVMRIMHKQDKSNHPYYQSNTGLKSVKLCRDLGVYVSGDLSWSSLVRSGSSHNLLKWSPDVTRTLIGRICVLYERLKHGAKVVMRMDSFLLGISLILYHKTNKGTLIVLSSVVKHLGSG